MNKVYCRSLLAIFFCLTCDSFGRVESCLGKLEHIHFYKVTQILINSIKEIFTWQTWIYAIVGIWCNNMNILLTTVSLFYERQLFTIQFNFLSVNECNDRISAINNSRKLFVIVAAKIQCLGLPPIENCMPGYMEFAVDYNHINRDSLFLSGRNHLLSSDCWMWISDWGTISVHEILYIWWGHQYGYISNLIGSMTRTK